MYKKSQKKIKINKLGKRGRKTPTNYGKKEEEKGRKITTSNMWGLFLINFITYKGKKGGMVCTFPVFKLTIQGLNSTAKQDQEIGSCLLVSPAMEAAAESMAEPGYGGGG